MNYNIWNKWDKLQTVMLGDCHSPDYFRDIKNTKIKSALQRIASESQEDLENYSNILKDFGCTVLRPKLDNNDSIMHHLDSNGHLTDIGRTPLQPRDAQVVIGNNLFYTTNTDHPSIRKTLDQYDGNCTFKTNLIEEKNYLNYKGNDAPDWPTYDDLITRFCNDSELTDNVDLLNILKNEQSSFFPVEAPSITVVGKDIYLDSVISRTHTLKHFAKRHLQIILDYYYYWFCNKFDNFRINFLRHGGHSDGCFHTIKPGAILSLREIQNYENTFPEWEVCYVPDQSWTQIKPFYELKLKNKGKWWVPGEEDNDEFTHFVETWLQDWVGYVEETVFDVNCLVLDEHHVCISQDNNEIVNAFLKKHKMEPVYVPWRHRYFWDGGLHCITLDLKRQGTQKDYFPKRQTPIIDKGFINV